ncbi:hypothetical protein SMICM304S_01731 [Streptomyces microflavus]
MTSRKTPMSREVPLQGRPAPERNPAVPPDVPVPASWRIALPHSTAAVPIARALVRTALSDIHAPADSDTAELLTAELVANAVEHTVSSEPIELVVELLPTGCQVEVHDHDPAAPPGDLSRPPHGYEVDPGRSWPRPSLLSRALQVAAGHGDELVGALAAQAGTVCGAGIRQAGAHAGRSLLLVVQWGDGPCVRVSPVR